jgi:iron complex transport system substrate-binding protein
MKKIRVKIAITILGFALVLSACQTSPVVDGSGEEIALDGPAKKIISISPSTTEILFAVGAGDRVIGRDSNSLYPEEAQAVLDLGGMWEGVPVEDILALEPDLIVMGENISRDTAEELRAVGLTVYWQANPNDFSELFENIRQVASMTGNQKEADDLIKGLEKRIEAAVDLLTSVVEEPLVFYELDATDPANPWTAGKGTFISYIITQAKGKNLGDSLDGDWVQISSEELIAQNPDYILLADAMFGVEPESVKERAGWSEIDAVTNNLVVPFDPNILSIPGPRLVDGLEEVIRIIHPGLGDQ